MVANGCRYMFFGVEHTLPEVALAIDKYNGSLQSKLAQAGAYPAKVREVFTQMGVVGLPSSYFVILGLPKAKLSRDRSMVVGYEQTTLEDDVAAIQYGVEECDPDFLNFNLLRFMPGSRAADIEGHRAFSVIRPSKEKPVTAGYFLPRVAEMNRYHLERNHGIYRMCESIGANQPTTTAMDPEKVHRCMSIAIDLINRKIDRGGKPTKLFLDKEVVDRKLVERSEAGRYNIAPLKEFECLA
jgi:anaerobic magnesium-protoporphyrin IX monomethyl ester cyclase